MNEAISTSNKGINFNDVILFDANPRFSTTAKSKERLRKLNLSILSKEDETEVAKNLVKYEGDLADLCDLIRSIINKGFIEASNSFSLFRVYDKSLQETKNFKYIVADGNRRLLVLKIISQRILFEKIVTKDQKNSDYYKKIITILNEFDINKLKFKFLEHSRIYDFSLINTLFSDEINFQHTGSGNGKRMWPRGKLLREISILHKNSVTDKEAINKIVNELGISERKAASDIPSAIWVTSLVDEYNKYHDNDQIDLSLISPSPLELIRSKNFSDYIINNHLNIKKEQNILKLFNIRIIVDKNLNRTSFLYEKIENIKFNVLAELLLSGYKEQKSRNSDCKIDNKFDKFDIEEERDKTSGLIKNIDYTTRGWNNCGEEKLLKCLAWPNGSNINLKIGEIIKTPAKMTELSYDDIKKILDQTEIKLDKNVEKQLEQLSINEYDLSIKLKYGKINKKYVHNFDVLKAIYESEFLFLEYKDINKKPYCLKNDKIVSQFAILRTMYELLSKIIYNIIMNKLMLAEKADFSLKDHIDWFSINAKNNRRSFNPAERLSCIFNIYIEKDLREFDLYIRNEHIAPSFFSNYYLLMKNSQEIIKPYFGENGNKFNAFFKKTQSLSSSFEKGINIKTDYKDPLIEKHSILSMPLHHLEKCINDNGSLNLRFTVNNLYKLLRKECIQYIEYLDENWEYLKYSDGDLLEYYRSQLKIMELLSK